MNFVPPTLGFGKQKSEAVFQFPFSEYFFPLVADVEIYVLILQKVKSKDLVWQLL
jgi:hypothetical protein